MKQAMTVSLSEMEKDILMKLSEGDSNSAIAEALSGATLMMPIRAMLATVILALSMPSAFGGEGFQFELHSDAARDIPLLPRGEGVVIHVNNTPGDNFYASRAWMDEYIQLTFDDHSDDYTAGGFAETYSVSESKLPYRYIFYTTTINEVLTRNNSYQVTMFDLDTRENVFQGTSSTVTANSAVSTSGDLAVFAGNRHDLFYIETGMSAVRQVTSQWAGEGFIFIAKGSDNARFIVVSVGFFGRPNEHELWLFDVDNESFSQVAPAVTEGNRCLYENDVRYISNDGKYVLFDVRGCRLNPEDQFIGQYLYLKNMESGTVTALNHDYPFDGALYSFIGPSSEAVVSEDGKLIAYQGNLGVPAVEYDSGFDWESSSPQTYLVDVDSQRTHAVSYFPSDIQGQYGRYFQVQSSPVRLASITDAGGATKYTLDISTNARAFDDNAVFQRGIYRTLIDLDALGSGDGDIDGDSGVSGGADPDPAADTDTESGGVSPVSGGGGVFWLWPLFLLPAGVRWVNARGAMSTGPV